MRGHANYASRWARLLGSVKDYMGYEGLFDRGDNQTALGLAEHYLNLAQRAPRLLPPPGSPLLNGDYLLHLGEVTLAHSYIEQGIALDDHLQYRSPAFSFGRTGADTGLCCRIMAACSLWLLGYPEQALERLHRALTLAQERSHPDTLAYVLSYAALVHQFRREWQAVQARLEALIALSTEQDLRSGWRSGLYIKAGCWSRKGR